ncbi:MAG TPA: AAA family ATPase [Candidatus Babeliales bacterium]|nr:AAA family ATPase [Candidatus Babeliales bacterium]
MLSGFLLNQKTKKQIEHYLMKPAQALLITGPNGSGKKTISMYIASKLTIINLEKINEYPYLKIVSKPKDKQEIPIATIRGIISDLRLKPVFAKDRFLARIVFIDGADNLSEEAQNALLKAIEEPPTSTFFILTTPSDSNVLPTIASRTTKLPVLPVSLDDTKKFYSSRFQDSEIESAWRLSQGAVGLMDALLNENQSHPLKIAIDAAKKLLRMNQYERILFMDSYSADKANLGALFDALNRILTALHHAAIESGNSNLTKKLTVSRKLTDTAVKSLDHNSSARLTGLNYVLKLPV